MPRKQKVPACNASKEAARLRGAAMKFWKGVGTEPVDYDDTAGMKRNIALLKAAMDYTAIVADNRGHSDVAVLIRSLKGDKE